MTSFSAVQPGDFAVVDTGSPGSPLIELGEMLSGGGFSQFDHAVICSRVLTDGTIMIVEAELPEAIERPWHYQDCHHLWSTGLVQTSPAAGAAALKYVGTPYSVADYFAIAAHTLHLPGSPWLRNYVASSKHMICSQLVDRAEADAGVHLFSNRWEGYVRPSDLTGLILGEGP